MISDATLVHLGYNFTPALEPVFRYEWFEEGLLDDNVCDIVDYNWQEHITLGVRYTALPNHLTISGYYLYRTYYYTVDIDPGISYNTSYHYRLGILEMQLTF
jgi:hypothetical protein